MDRNEICAKVGQIISSGQLGCVCKLIQSTCNPIFYKWSSMSTGDKHNFSFSAQTRLLFCAPNSLSKKSTCALNVNFIHIYFSMQKDWRRFKCKSLALLVLLYKRTYERARYKYTMLDGDINHCSSPFPSARHTIYFVWINVCSFAYRCKDETVENFDAPPPPSLFSHLVYTKGQSKFSLWIYESITATRHSSPAQSWLSQF